MRYSLSMIGLWGLLTGASAWASAPHCPQVDCDCQAFEQAQWRNLCEANETAVRVECAEHDGNPQSYCGLHGPHASPLPLSITPITGVEALTENQITDLNKQVATQLWSLNDDLKTVMLREELAQFGDALQILKLFESNVSGLMDLQNRSLAGAGGLDSPQAKIILATDYATSTMKLAENLDNSSQSFWQSYQASAQGSKAQRGYRLLTFRAARLAGTVYEQAAQLQAEAEQYEQAARAWQTAANRAERLVEWVAIADGDPRHIAFYREQASARWHRATYHWLQKSDQEQAQRATQQALQVLEESESEATDEGRDTDSTMTQPDLESDQ